MKDALPTYETYCQRDLQEPHFSEGHHFRKWSPTVGETIALASFVLQKPIDDKYRDYIRGLLGSGENWGKMEGYITDWNQALANSSTEIALMQKLYRGYLASALIEERVNEYELKRENIDYLEKSWARGNYEEAYSVAVKEVKGLAPAVKV